MADPGSRPQAPPDDGKQGESAGVPRWVKISGIVTLLIVVLLIVMALTGGHGPGRHAPDDGASPGVGVTGGGHMPPAGGHG